MAAVIESEAFRGTAAASRKNFEKGKDMDDVIERLGAVESAVDGLKGTVGELRTEVGKINVLLPNLATKGDVSELRAEMCDRFSAAQSEMNKGLSEVRAELRAEMNRGFGELRTDMNRSVDGLRAGLSEMSKGLSETNKSVGEIKERFGSLETRIKMLMWFVVVGTAIVSVMIGIAKFG
jgi:archaellum component FlaC